MLQCLLIIFSFVFLLAVPIIVYVSKRSRSNQPIGENDACGARIWQEENITHLLAPAQTEVIKVYVHQHDAVAKGDKLFLIEAMKLEYEIVAPNDGYINEVCVLEGDTVKIAAPLCTMTTLHHSVQ